MANSKSPPSKSLPFTIWLLLILSGIFLVLVLPAGYFSKTTLEAHLVDQNITQLVSVHTHWRNELDERLLMTEASVIRLGKLLTLSLGVSRGEQVDAEFDKLVGKTNDGNLKSRPEAFDAKKQAGIWVPPSYPIDAGERLMFVQAKRILEAYQTGKSVDFIDTWMLPIRGGEVIFWPAAPQFLGSLTADTDYTQTEWVTLVKPDQNPKGEARWTPTSYDPVAKIWMVSAIAPFYRDDKFGGSVGHDIPIDNLAQTAKSCMLYEGMHWHFVRDDGTMLASSERQNEITTSNGTINVEKLADDNLANAFRTLHQKSSEDIAVLFEGGDGRVYLGAHLNGPDWYFISTVPRASILRSVQSSYRTRWLQLLAAFFISLIAPVLLISSLILPSLRAFVASVLLVRDGDFSVRFKRDRVRELDHVAIELNEMIVKLAASIEEREANLALLAESERKTRQMLEERTQNEEELRKQLRVIEEQQETINLLSTPIIEVWDDVLALPVIGRFDEKRAAQATEVLLEAITRTQATTAILDLTGAYGVDDSTATHLLKLVQAVKLLGADVTVTGLRRETARGMISVGIDLSTISTKSTLREGLRAARKIAKESSSKKRS